MGTRLFEVAELKMLVEAISSSRFISRSKSEALIRKLEKLTNEQNRSSLTDRNFTEDRIKTTNPTVLQNTDVIQQALDRQKKISFHYWDYTPEMQKVLRHDGELYITSPYALIWNDDRYYLASFSDKHQKVVSFRVDRMCDVQMLEEDAVTDYAGRLPNLALLCG